MSKETYHVLTVDDEEFNRDILSDLLSDAGYRVTAASDGQQGLLALDQSPDVDVIVLDRMMPIMDGMEMLHHLKSSERFKDIPVIMQTAAANSQQVLEGIQAGVYYYLAKPYDAALLLSIVKAALRDHVARLEMRDEVQKHRHTLGLMERARFRFRTLEEAHNLCYFVANCFADPAQVVYGLNELMVNAVEHGNLGIAYDEKSALAQEGTWLEEVERRLSAPAYADRFATLDYEVQATHTVVTIRDQGEGFDWRRYLEFDPDRAMDPNGRGIAITKMRSFPDLEYRGNGNEVVCRLPR